MFRDQSLNPRDEFGGLFVIKVLCIVVLSVAFIVVVR